MSPVETDDPDFADRLCVQVAQQSAVFPGFRHHFTNGAKPNPSEQGQQTHQHLGGGAGIPQRRVPNVLGNGNRQSGTERITRMCLGGAEDDSREKHRVQHRMCPLDAHLMPVSLQKSDVERRIVCNKNRVAGKIMEGAPHFTDTRSPRHVFICDLVDARGRRRTWAARIDEAIHDLAFYDPSVQHPDSAQLHDGVRLDR